MSSGKTAGSRVPSTSSATAASSPAPSALASSSSGVHGLHRPSITSTSASTGAGAGAASLNSGTFSPLAPLLSLIPRALIPSQTQLDLLILSTLLKLLLVPTYHSTDFEVHRNWLAITHSVPLRGWYFDTGSEWTLDYPPFFAYFSYVLGVPNAWFGWGDARITHVVEGLGLANESTKTYMRASVLLTELVLGAALVAHSRAPRLGRLSPGHLEKQINEHHVRAASRPSAGGGGAGSESATHLPPSIRLLGRKITRFFGGALDFDEATATLLAASVFFHPGLVIIDHIHFQYNGFLFGVLLWAIWAARERRLLLCAVLFSSLLNLKHIYVYIAPAFTVFLLRTYVIPPGAESKLRTHPDIFFLAIERLLGLALVTLLPFAFSLGPLVWDTLANGGGGVGEHGVGAVLGQVLARLFPFSRGLNHAYWAPNAWALWTFTDRIALKLLRARPALGQLVPQYFSRNVGNASAVQSASRGLVGDTTFAVLPEITPGLCFGLTVLAMGPFLAYLWVRPSYRRFLAALTGCGFASFLFGWHVHEKAVLLVLIPFTPLAVQSYTHFRIWTIVSAAGIVSLFPLLFEVRETPIKVGYSLLWAIVVGGQLKRKVYRPVPSNLGLVVHFLEDMYLLGLVPLQMYVDVLHPMLFSGSTSSTPSSSSMVGGVAAAAAPVLSAAVSMAQPLITPLQSAAENVVEHEAGSITAAAAAAVAAAVPTGILAANTSLAQATAASSATDTPVVVVEASLEFLPLMLTSVYCALGVCWAWARLGWACWHNEGEDLGAVGGVEGGEKNVVLEGSHGEEEAAEAEYRLSQQQQGVEGGDGLGVNGGGGGAAGRYPGLPVLGGDIVNSPGLPPSGYGHGHGHIHGLPAFGGHMIPPRIRAPISDDARSSGSVRVRRGRLQGAESPLQQQQQQQQLHGGDALPMPMPVRKRKVTGTGAGAAAVAASAAATAGARME